MKSEQLIERVFSKKEQAAERYKKGLIAENFAGRRNAWSMNHSGIPG